MVRQDQDTLYVIAAAYDELHAAVDDYETIRDLYREVRTSYHFDASVIAKDEDGNLRIVKQHEQPTRHGTAVGLGWGVAVGLAAALFPPLSVSLAAAAGTGAALGGVAGHVTGGMSRSDLKELGGTLRAGQASLIVVYKTNVTDRITANTKAADRFIAAATTDPVDQDAPDFAADRERVRLVASLRAQQSVARRRSGR